jgi:ATP-dependent Clp protease adaptor protein ClpS
VADGQDRPDGAVKERPDIKNDPKKQDPALFKVVLLNDDYTTMEFVLHILETLFQKSPAEAYRIMMHVHQNGRGIAGVYPWEVAETKAATVRSLAADAGFPLRAAIEDA